MYLDVERDRISLNRDRVSIDAVQFQELANEGKAQEALELYNGPLLQGLSVADQSFEDWVSRERQRFNELAIDVHETSIKELAGRDRIKLARQLLELDPLREASHRILIEALAAAGERDLALRQYEACRDMLQSELGVKPEPRTTQLFDRLAQTSERHLADKQTNETGGSKSSAAQTSLAVLPFINLSGNSDQDFFAAGITEDLIAELARYRNVKVVGHRTFGAVSSPPSDLAEFGKHHGLDFVVEGSVRWSTNRVRVSVRLVDSHSAAHVWADHFDRELDDILTVQDEIVGAVVSRLAFNLEGAAGDQRQRDPTTSGTAYTWFLRGRAAWRDGEERKALQLIKKATEIDPEYARAHAYAAWFYAYGAFSQATGLNIEETDRQARAGIERALSLDRSDPFVLHRASMAYLLLGEPLTGLRYAEAAARQNPRDAEILVVHGFCLVCCGEAQRGVGMLEKAIALEPYAPPSFYATLSDCRYFVGDYAGSLQALDQILDAASYLQLCRVPALAQLGRLSEAKAIIDETPSDIDMKRLAKCFHRICARPVDAEHWLEGLSRCLHAARWSFAGSWQYRDRSGRSRKSRETVMPSKQQPATSKSARRVHNKSVASIKRASREVQPATKKQRLINLLSGAKPVAAEKLSKTLDWQPHTVRAAITRLRKAGFVIDNTRGFDGSGTCYQIVSHPQSIEPAA